MHHPSNEENAQVLLPLFSLDLDEIKGLDRACDALTNSLLLGDADEVRQVSVVLLTVVERVLCRTPRWQTEHEVSQRFFPWLDTAQREEWQAVKVVLALLGMKM
jgi:hypothetical protein